MNFTTSQIIVLILVADAFLVGLCVFAGQWILDRFFPEGEPVRVRARVAARRRRRR